MENFIFCTLSEHPVVFHIQRISFKEFFFHQLLLKRKKYKFYFERRQVLVLSNKHLCYIFNLSKIKLINYTRAYKRMHASRFRNYSVQEVKRFFMTGRYGLSVRRGHTVILDLLLGVPLLSSKSC